MRLIEQSLVGVRVRDGSTRYGFLETVRAYADEQLHAAEETSAMQARHRDWCLAFVERAAAGLTGKDFATWFRLLTEEHDNVRAALDSCGEHPATGEGELRLVAAMGQFWFPRKPAEGRRRLAAALDRAPSTPSSAHSAALYWSGAFELHFGNPLYGRELLRGALADARAVGFTGREARYSAR
jgi:non-specific serine/threonine protein kinase